MTPKQIEDYQHYTGATVVQAVRDQQQSGEWAKLSDQQKVLFVNKTQSVAKKEVRNALLQQDGWLTKGQLDTLRSTLSGKQ